MRGARPRLCAGAGRGRARARYWSTGGRPASFLRGYLSIHSGVLCNAIIIGWVNLAMVKVLSNTVGVDEMHALYFCFGFSLVYTMLAGLRGVMVTDLLQFVISMFGSIYLAVVAVRADKPIVTYRTQCHKQDGTLVLEGEAVCLVPT